MSDVPGPAPAVAWQAAPNWVAEPDGMYTARLEGGFYLEVYESPKGSGQWVGGIECYAHYDHDHYPSAELAKRAWLVKAQLILAAALEQVTAELKEK